MNAIAMRQAACTPPLPEPGWRKRNPRELDRLLDTGIEDSMPASDPPAVTQPEVHKRMPEIGL